MTCNNTQNNTRTIPSNITTNPSFQLYNNSTDNKTLNEYATESTQIGGTIINVYKLLGIYEQKSLTALNGNIISNGEYPEFPADNLKENNCKEWRSIKHCGKRSPNTFIGYDFGDIKLSNNSNKYAIHSENKYHVTSIFIQQSENTQNRISKARLENSNDGINYKGISLIDLPNDDKEHWIDVKQSFPARYWRIVPTIYNGSDNDLWILKKLAFSEYTKTNIKNLQDDIFLENRDRNYSMDFIPIKAFYSIQDITTNLQQFGIQLNNQYSIKFNFNLTLYHLNRPIIIGDILEIPCETQYDTSMNPIKKYLEITDVSYDSSNFTPGWQPTFYTVIAEPLIASQETADIVGDLNNRFFDSIETFNPSFLKSSDKIRAEYNTMVPEIGASHNDSYTIDDITIKKGLENGINLNKLNFDPNLYLVNDGMPPNGLPYTEGEKYPENPKDGDYHRITYYHLKDPASPRLYQFSEKKNRWIFLETDERIINNDLKPHLGKFDNGLDPSKINR